MNKQAIINLHQTNWQDLKSYVTAKDENWWAVGPDGKWTAGQHIVHLQQTITAVLGGLKYPGFVFKYQFGSANRPVREHEVVVQNYKDKLAAAGDVTAPISSSMPVTPVGSRAAIIAKFDKDLVKLQKKLAKYSDKKLDTLLIPHPLMGRMIFREFFGWHAYHIEHHLMVLKERY